MKTIARYNNGNANVMLFNDGTRIIGYPDDEELVFDKPISIDCKISNRCSMGCPMCHENSKPDGDNATLENLKFLETMIPGTEVAFGGGSVTENSDFEKILYKAKSCNLISNVTFHYKELINHKDEIIAWQKSGLIYGIGVSYPGGLIPKDLRKLFKTLRKLKNVVFHIIEGMIETEDIAQLSELCYTFEVPMKVLILGYKEHTGRGINYYLNNSNAIKCRRNDLYLELYKYFDDLQYHKEHNVFKNSKCVSFDNLALKNLHMKSLISNERWDILYQGDEGTTSMYVDAVRGEFAINSTSTIRYKMLDNIKDMFSVIKEEADINGYL